MLRTKEMAKQTIWDQALRKSGAIRTDLACERSQPRLALFTKKSALRIALDRSLLQARSATDCAYKRDPVRWLQRSVLPPTEAPGRKKRTGETTQQATDAGPSVRHTRQQATGLVPSVQPAGPLMQPVGPSVPTSRKKKGAKRPRGKPKKVVNPGKNLLMFEVIPDIERHVRWCYVTGDQRHSALRVVRNRELTASGLFTALDLPVHRPHISACLEFIHSAVTLDPREGVSPLDLPMEATVRGRTVRLDAALVRAAFVLPATSMEIKRQVRHSLIVDWFREYERNGKRYIARTCLHRE
ncbi:hypothetical protein R1sor_008538 [Riccia sorocarpa]|uniref:HNH homing endonuclease n=1 Tax=Riccia sorocarpa TaxID=122646 RepID=A0ABD3HX83_9MARC